MEQNLIHDLQALLTTKKNIAIIPHRNPDGDAMGASLALYHFLKKNNHNVSVIAPNEFPNFLHWLPSANEVLIYEKNRDNVINFLKDIELIFTLDFNALHRTGEFEKVLKNLSATFIMIDHHELPDHYAKITFSDTSYGSTCEMVYDCIEKMGQKNSIDKNIATCLYTGITTDSGSFRFPKTTSKTHRIVAELIDKGVENTKVHQSLFDANSFDGLQLLGKALQNMTVIKNKKTAYTFLSQKDLDHFNYKKGDTEGIVNYGLSISGIMIAAIFIENKEEGIIKISLRSKGDYDVNTLARNHFNGGGHIHAAGGRSELSLEETIKLFEKIINNQIIS